jgi:cell division protein FtsQ
MTAVNMDRALLNGLDDSEFVTLSPIRAEGPFLGRGAGGNGGGGPLRGAGGDLLEEEAGARSPLDRFEERAFGPPLHGRRTEEEAAARSPHDRFEERASGPPSRVQKVFRMLFFVCVLFFAGELAWLFLITPMRPFSLVVVTGVESGFMERNEVLRVAGIGTKTSYLSFDTKAAERSLLSVPPIESAKVVKQFPGSVRITVVPRKSVALFLRNVNGKVVPAYFDRHGVVFKVGVGAGEKALLSVPVVSGLEAASGPGAAPISEGERLASVYIPLFENLAKLSSASPALYEAISEIAVNKKTYDGFDVTLFPSQSPVKMRVNADLDEETIGRAFLLLDVLEAKGVRVSEIDYRAGTASYMVKGVND